MRYFLFLPAAAAALFTVFIVMFLRRPARLRNGFVFDLFLGAALTCVIFALGSSRSGALYAAAILLAVVLALVVLFGAVALLVYLFTSSVKMLRRENHSLQNMLSLILLLGVAVQTVVVAVLGTGAFHNTVALVLLSYVYICEFYLLVSMISFITVTLLILAVRPRPGTEYVVVLGCGLLRGREVSPLLAGRVDKAVAFYRKAVAKGRSPVLVMSGGQGVDEQVPEAEAMYAYALSKGVPESAMRRETRSRNTRENLAFSKELIAGENSGRPVGQIRCAVASNGYHVYRGVFYAMEAGLRRVRVLGSRTAGYFLPNAFIREYLAVMMINRRSNIALLVISASAYIAGAVLLAVFAH